MLTPVILAGAAVWLLLPRRGLNRLRTEDARRPGLRLAAALSLVALSVLLVALFGVGAAVVIVAAGSLAAVVIWLWLRAADRRRAHRVALSVAAACQLMAGQLRVGRFPAHALRLASADCLPLRSVHDQDRVGAEIPPALRAAALQPGASGLGSLAAAWELSVRTGAPLSGAVLRVADQLREDELLHEEVGTELAASRATGKVLALLPVVGIAMAGTVGAEPVHFLIRTLVGQCCLAGSLLLTAAGLVWTELLADQASPEAQRTAHRRSSFAAQDGERP